MTTALEGGEWSAARPGRTLPPGKDPVPIVQEAGWASRPAWMGRKSRPIRTFFYGKGDENRQKISGFLYIKESNEQLRE